MSWFPIGPDFVFAPYNPNFKRLSIRNEQGRQGLVSQIAVDPTDQATIYVAERPSSGGTSAFRTRDGGRSWLPIADSLQQGDPTIDPMCFAVNPSHPETVYMGIGGSGVYVSSNRGEPGSWSARHSVPGAVRKLIVDPRSAGTLTSTILYAATTSGVYRSADGGVNWTATALVPGDVWTLEAHFPASGSAQFFAGSRGTGVFHAEDSNVTAGWRNLNQPPATGSGTGLPAPGTFDGLLVGLCPRNPSRAYAWMLDSSATTMSKLWTTSAPETAWTSITMAGPPSPWYGYYAMSFAVAPNSPGDGLNDILLFGSGGIQRSVDSGRTWQVEAEAYHADQHAIAFFPAEPGAGTVPTTYIGCDGGIAKSDRYADPAFSITAAAVHNEGAAQAASGSWENLNHGKQSSAVYTYAGPLDVPQLSYIGVQDTGINAGGTSLGWRAVENADGGSLAAATGPDGVHIWGNLGQYGGWPTYRLRYWLDQGGFSFPSSFVTSGASQASGTSNCENGPAGSCITGGLILGGETTLKKAVTGGAAAQAVEPASMAGIVVGSQLVLEANTANQETVTVTAVSATTFTAVISRSHAVGAALANQRAHVLRLDDGTAAVVSQDFMPALQVNAVAVSITNPDIACAAGSQRLFTTNALSTATAATTWSEATTGKPAAFTLSDLTVSPGNDVFVLMAQPITAGSITTPLFKVSGGSWQAQQCAGLPTGFDFGKLVADPLDSDLLYATHGGRVYRLALSGGTWQFTDISEGLPGGWIYDLAARATGSRAAPQVLLRAAIPTRAVFECDPRQTAADPPTSLYLRDHPMDSGWGAPSSEGVANPYRPAETLWHYMCADVKVDAHEVGPAGVGTFYQTDPEGNPIPPLDHVRFDQLLDDASNLPQADTARVHVQVHNRSHDPSGEVTVWVLYCNASAGPPALSTSASQGNAFPFWSQFNTDGTISPNLPADSPWHVVGPPQTITGLSVTEPKVASWLWSMPTLPSGDPGHFCMAVFVHSAASPIGETTRVSIDELANVNRQVGQKNLHIGAPLPPSPAPGGGGPGTTGGSPGTGAPGGRSKLFEYVEFHNPTEEDRVSDLVFDLRRIPPALGVSLQLTPLQTEGPLESSLVGVSKTRPTEAGDRLPAAKGIPILSWLWALILAILCWLVNLVRQLLGRPTKPCGHPKVQLPQFEPVVHEAESGTRVAVKGVKLGPFGSAAALIAFEPVAPLPPGERFTVDVQQWENGAILAGGSLYVVNTEGEKKPPKGEIPPPPTMDHRSDREEVERLEREGEELRYVPPFIKKLVEERESEQEKR
jgi:hypothetical protein